MYYYYDYILRLFFYDGKSVCASGDVPEKDLFFRNFLHTAFSNTTTTLLLYSVVASHLVNAAVSTAAAAAAAAVHHTDSGRTRFDYFHFH